MRERLEDSSLNKEANTRVRDLQKSFVLMVYAGWVRGKRRLEDRFRPLREILCLVRLPPPRALI
jgi:hypothetical protein